MNLLHQPRVNRRQRSERLEAGAFVQPAPTGGGTRAPRLRKAVPAFRAQLSIEKSGRRARIRPPRLFAPGEGRYLRFFRTFGPFLFWKLTSIWTHLRSESDQNLTAN